MNTDAEIVRKGDEMRMQYRNMSEFGKAVALLREQRKETLQQVADAVCMTKSYIWEIENKPSIRPSATTAHKLSQHFGVTVEYLLGFECWESAVDKAFFTRYMEASPEIRCQVRDILTVLESTPDPQP